MKSLVLFAIVLAFYYYPIQTFHNEVNDEFSEVITEVAFAKTKDTCDRYDEHQDETNDLLVALEEKNSILTKELDMARQIIGELNIKLSNKEIDLATVSKSFSVANTSLNMNIEEILLVSIDECSKQVKSLKAAVEGCTALKNNCEQEKSAMTLDLNLLSVKSELLMNEKAHCLLDMRRISIEKEMAQREECGSSVPSAV